MTLINVTLSVKTQYNYLAQSNRNTYLSLHINLSENVYLLPTLSPVADNVIRSHDNIYLNVAFTYGYIDVVIFLEFLFVKKKILKPVFFYILTLKRKPLLSILETHVEQLFTHVFSGTTKPYQCFRCCIHDGSWDSRRSNSEGRDWLCIDPWTELLFGQLPHLFQTKY